MVIVKKSLWKSESRVPMASLREVRKSVPLDRPIAGWAGLKGLVGKVQDDSYPLSVRVRLGDRLVRVVRYKATWNIQYLIEIQVIRYSLCFFVVKTS